MTTPNPHLAEAEPHSLLAEIAATRWSQRRAILIAITLTATLTTGLCFVGARPGNPLEIRSEQFTLVDAKGKDRAVLKCQGDGTPSFYMKDEDGSVKLGIRLTSDGGSLISLMNKDDDPRVTLESYKDGTCQLNFLGNGGMPRLVLESNDDEEKAELLLIQGGEMKSALHYSRGGINGLTICGSDANYNAHVGQDETGRVFIGITDKEGKTVILQRVDEGDRAYMQVVDPKTGEVTGTIP